jgi:hypothetical protein
MLSILKKLAFVLVTAPIINKNKKPPLFSYGFHIEPAEGLPETS